MMVCTLAMREDTRLNRSQVLMFGVLVALVWLVTSFVLMSIQVEPFATEFYLFAWFGLIFLLDSLIRRSEGSSLVLRCGGRFLLLVLWSAACWFFFELLNFRLENWYYVFVSDDDKVRLIGTFLAFGTVFPGIFWIDHYLDIRGIATHLRGPRLAFSAARLSSMQVAGVLLLALSMLFPQYCFALVWVGPILIVAPMNYRRGGNNLLRQLSAGFYGPAVRLLLAGLVAGLFWEFFNYWARAKWIYTVPFFDDLKLFEMPLVGFLGFPPFAIECAEIYRLLVWHRLVPAFGCFADQKPYITKTLTKAVVAGLAMAFSLGVYVYVDRWTISSVTPRVERVEGLDDELRDVLAEIQITHLTDLQGHGAQARWLRLEDKLEDNRHLAHLRATTELYLHAGIGTCYGNLLVRAGIESLERLRLLSAEEVLTRLRVLEPELDLSLNRVHIWTRRAASVQRKT